MMKNEKRFTDIQLQNRLAKLDVKQKYCFFQYAEPLLNKESDEYLSVLSHCRMSFADALAKIREEENSEEDEQGDQEEQILAAATPFDTTTQLGQNLAKLSRAFAELLEVQRPGSAVDVARTKIRSKKSRRKSLYEEMEEKSKFRMNLATELNNAAQEEQEIILDKMKSHGKKIDAERRRQSEKTTEKLNEAREKKHGRADAVESLLDKKEELSGLHEKGRSRQEKALKERLEQLKQQETMELANEESKEQSVERKRKKDQTG
ncbi:hypothetical protein P879_06284 [Paragonimus westermani]|uniref:Uncharacterized protein n=1 Tax=Paragonimus westermani TaxID=34504 RepID=A0A8T0DKQ6_9TREM|nr:hypothetical protein P879_06284 [Paragonimus westermani]